MDEKFIDWYIEEKKVKNMESQIISVKEVGRYAFRNEYVIIDLRSPGEFRKQHIKGAVCIPYERLKEQVKLLGRERTLILYCDRGGLSMKAANELMELGYDAWSVVGGIEAYFH